MADGRVVIDVMLEDGSVAKGVANLDNQLSGLEKSGEKASLGIGKIVTALGFVALGAKAIGMVRDSIQSAFNRIDIMESFDRTMTAITGSSEAAAAALDRTSDAVTGTAYGLDVAAQAVQNFVTRGTEIEKATDYVAAWGDAVAFYGDGSNEQLANVTDALAKMLTTGKVTMDQVNRLYDAGIAAPEMYADATGKSMEEVQKGFQNGEISAEEFVDVVTKAMMEGTDNFVAIEGAAKEAGASWRNVFGNMRTAVTRGTIAIIQAIDEMLTSNGLPDMRTMIAEFGVHFENVLKKLAETIPPTIERIKEIYNALEPWLPILGAVAAGVGTVVVAIAGFNTVNGYIKAVQVAMMGLNKTVWMNPWTWVAAAAVAAIILIYQNWEPISDFFINLWERIKEVGIAVWDWLKEVWVSTVEFFVSIWTGITEFFTGLWNSIVEVATGIWDAVVAKWNEIVAQVMAIFGPIVDFYTTMWNAISTNAMQIWENIRAMLERVWTNIQTAAKAAWELVKNVILGPILLLINLVTGDMESFKSNLSQIWDNIKNAAQTIWNALKDTVVTIITTLIDNAKLVWDTFKTYISTLWATILTIAQNIFNNIASAVRERTTQAKDTVTSIWGTVRSFFTEVLSNIWNTVQQKFQDIVNAVKQKMEEAKNNVVRGWNASVEFLRSIDLLQIGKDIIQGLINGITQKVEDVKNAVKNVTDAITGTVKSILQIHSPSRVAIGLTNDFGDGMVIGLEKSKDEVEKASGKLADSVWKPVTDATTRAITSIMQDAKKAGKAAKDGANRVKAEFDEAMKSSASRYELGQISTEQYVAALKAIEFEFAKTAEQRRKIAKELKDAEEKYVKETFDASMKFIERRKYFNQMTLEQELTSYERMIERYKAGSEEYEKLEREIYRVKKAVEEEKQKLEKEAFDKSKAWIDERKYYNEMSLADELAAWQRVHDTHINNIELRKQAERELYRVRQQMVEQIKKLDQDYYRRREEINNRLIAEEKRLRDEYQKTLDARTKSLVSFAGLFDEVTKKEEVSGQQLIENLRGQVTTFENWSRNIASLAKRGIDKGLLAELREMGPKAAAEIEALNGLTDAELAEYSNLFKQKNQLAQQQAESELEKMKSTTDRQIKQLRENTKIELDELRLEWSRQVSRIREGTTGEFTGMAEEMPDIGKSAMEGLKDGMASMEDELIATAKGIADKIAQTIRSAFNVPALAPPPMPGSGGSGGGSIGGAISNAGKALTNRSPIGAVINAGKALSGLSSALKSSSNVTNQSTTNNSKTNNITINSPKVSTPAEREREIKRLDRALSMG